MRYLAMDIDFNALRSFYTFTFIMFVEKYSEFSDSHVRAMQGSVMEILQKINISYYKVFEFIH